MKKLAIILIAIMIMAIFTISVYAIVSTTVYEETDDYGLNFRALENTVITIDWQGSQILIDRAMADPFDSTHKELTVATVGVVGKKWTITLEQDEILCIENIKNGQAVITYDDTAIDLQVGSIIEYVVDYNLEMGDYDAYQRWTSYPQSPLLTAQYKYQYITNSVPYNKILHMSPGPFYKSGSYIYGKDYEEGSATKTYYLDGTTQQWIYYGSAPNHSSSNILEANENIYDGISLINIYFLKTTGIIAGGGGGVGAIEIDEQPDIIDDDILPQPDRNDYMDGIIGDVQYGFAQLMWYIKIPFVWIGNAINELVEWLSQSIGWITNVSNFYKAIFGFLPTEIVGAFTTIIFVIVIFTIMKVLRG